jgi:hypothetical protein
MYTRRSVVFALSSAVALAQKNQKSKKPPEIELVECAVGRQADLIVLDGKVKNVTDHPIKGLQLLFDFISPEKAVITTKRGALEAEILEAGEEAEFHSQIEPPARATHCQVSFEDSGGKVLRAEGRLGPFPID